MSSENYKIRTDRLENARKLPLLKRLLNRIASYLVVFTVDFLGGLKSRKEAAGVVQNGKARIILTGRFESDNWISAHVRPLAASRYCECVYVVTDKHLKPIENVVYILPHSFSRRVFGDVVSRVMCLAFYSYRYNCNVVGGFHLLINGLVAYAIASLINAKSIYFCVGGWSEIIGGGSYSGTKMFGFTGTDDKSLENRLHRIIGRMDNVIVMGDKARRYLEQDAFGRVYKLPGGIDTNIFHGDSDMGEKDIDVIIVARLDPIKRIDRFVRIISKVAANKPDVTVAIVGDGPKLDESISLAKKLKVERNIVFAGYQGDVAAWLRRSRILALTSDSEGLPLSCMEAMSVGLPVIATNVGDLENLVSDGINGFLVEKENEEEFAAHITRLLRDKEFLATISAAAYKTSREFDGEAAISRWDMILEKNGFSYA